MNDRRSITEGHVIPSISYCDQPYVVATDDGAWLCIMTTGAGHEGAPGQTVIAVRSTDFGATWSEPVFVEPADGPEASYAVVLKAPSGRIYAFYNHNTDNVRRVKADNPPYESGFCERVDSLGHFVFKYSDDHGRTWSDERYEIPQRLFEIDRRNADGGRLLYFWNVGKAFIHAGVAYVPLHKVGGFGRGFFTRSEGVLLASANLLRESDPRKIAWETLPEGEIGQRTPPGGGAIAEEQSTVVLSDGSFFTVYRTIDGYPACCYSRDKGRTWSTPEYLCYADGHVVKHPRAANFIWRCANGKYLYWFHNHGGPVLGNHPRSMEVAYQERNPVWLSGAIEVDGPQGKVLRFSQPEIALYDDDPVVRMSYPDLIETDGRYFVTETQKTVARVHELSPVLVEGLWKQFEKAADVRDDRLQLELVAPADGLHPIQELPRFIQPDPHHVGHGLHLRESGITFDLVLDDARPGAVLLDQTAPGGGGFAVGLNDRNQVELTMADDWSESRCRSAPLGEGKRHHVGIVIDAGPRIVAFVIDGRLCDGGAERRCGWWRFSPWLRWIVAGETGDPSMGLAGLQVDPAVARLRIYRRALRISEALAVQRTAPA